MITWDINYLALFIAAAINMGLGMFWYSQFMFGKHWLKWMNKKSAQKPEMLVIVIAFFSGLIKAFFLLQIISLFNVLLVPVGIGLAIMLWLGFVVTTNLSTVLWEEKDARLYSLNMAFEAISIILMSIVLTLMP